MTFWIVVAVILGLWLWDPAGTRPHLRARDRSRSAGQPSSAIPPHEVKLERACEYCGRVLDPLARNVCRSCGAPIPPAPRPRIDPPEPWPRR